MRNLSNACVFGEFLLWIVLQCYCALRLDGEAQGGDPVGNDDEALSGRLPGLPGKSQFKRVAELLLADAGRHAGIAHYGFAARLEFRKAARSPRTPAAPSGEVESSHLPRLAAPGAARTRNSVPVMHGRLFEVQRPSPLPGTAPESAAPTVIRIAEAMGTSRPLGAGQQAKEPTINVNIGGVFRTFASSRTVVLHGRSLHAVQDASPMTEIINPVPAANVQSRRCLACRLPPDL